MAYKRKKRKAPKETWQTPEPSKSHRDKDELIVYNGELVERLLETEVWKEVLNPVISETIASVSGRQTNGYWFHGDLTRSTTNREFLAGYQKAAMDIHNRIIDFIKAKNDLLDKSKAELETKQQPVINPFLEDEYEG